MNVELVRNRYSRRQEFFRPNKISSRARPASGQSETSQKSKDAPAAIAQEKEANTKESRTIIRGRFSAEFHHGATFGLAEAAPEASARHIFSSARTRAIVLFAMLGIAVWAAVSISSLIIAINVLAIGSVVTMTLVRLALTIFAARKLKPKTAQALPSHRLPRVTILVPLFREAAMLPSLVNNLKRMDYPAHLLDIKILLEEEDTETIDEVYRLCIDEFSDVIVIPKSEPQTKPKACNYGLLSALGELVVIYDAEDAPERGQLREAAAVFACGDERLACVQARLNFYNADENWLTKLFTLDYSLWFDHMLPALDRLGAPIPLGGTSNIFRTKILLEAGGWDPFNVTEDADLGLRLARLGYKTEIIESTTFEEANCKVGNWVRQRSRWIKGYLQTWIVHRRPANARYNWRTVLSVDGFIGSAALAALANPVMVFFSILASAPWAPPQHSVLGLIGGSNAWIMAACNLILIALNFWAPRKRGHKALSVYAVLTPLYWALISVAAYRGLWQLIRSPFYWEKTDHGVSSAAPAQRAAALQAMGLD